MNKNIMDDSIDNYIVIKQFNNGKVEPIERRMIIEKQDNKTMYIKNWLHSISLTTIGISLFKEKYVDGLATY